MGVQQQVPPSGESGRDPLCPRTCPRSQDGNINFSVSSEEDEMETERGKEGKFPVSSPSHFPSSSIPSSLWPRAKPHPPQQTERIEG